MYLCIYKFIYFQWQITITSKEFGFTIIISNDIFYFLLSCFVLRWRIIFMKNKVVGGKYLVLYHANMKKYSFIIILIIIEFSLYFEISISFS